MANNLATEKKVLAVSMLAEGSSIRSIERITGVHRDTIMRPGVRVGEACAKIHDEKMRSIPSRRIEIDEIWGFIGKKIQVAIQELHKCGAVHRQSVPVHEVFRGQTVWQGEVEMFDLTGHPKAKRCYAWSHREGPQGQGERFVTVLEIPPVDSPSSAVKTSIVSDSKTKQTL